MSQLKVGSINPNYHGPFPLFPRDRVLATITHGQDPTIWIRLSP